MGVAAAGLRGIRAGVAVRTLHAMSSVAADVVVAAVQASRGRGNRGERVVRLDRFLRCDVPLGVGVGWHGAGPGPVLDPGDQRGQEIREVDAAVRRGQAVVGTGIMYSREKA